MLQERKEWYIHCSPDLLIVNAMVLQGSPVKVGEGLLYLHLSLP